MTIILNINDDRSSFFMELLKSLDYIKVVKEISGQSEVVQDLLEAFNDVKLHEEGKQELKSAKDFLNEL